MSVSGPRMKRQPHVSGTFGGYFVRDTSRTIGLLTTGLLLRDQVGEEDGTAYQVTIVRSA